MKVVALTRTSPIGPSTRYRIEQYRPALSRQGIDVVTLPLFGPTWFALLGVRSTWLRIPGKALYAPCRLLVRLLQIARAAFGDADLVLVEQQYFPYLPAWVEAALWIRRKPTILEFDDAIYLTFGHASKLRRLCGRATLVIVGNRFLEDFARPHARHLAVIPTTVDTDRYTTSVPRDDDVFRVAWIGLPYNLPYLELVARPLADLARRGRRCELRIISSALPGDVSAFEGLDVVARPWSVQTEADELSACDLGIMPVPDDEWGRGKCGLKILQYMAAGLPVVASPVGVNADIVQEGVTGRLAATPEDWRAALESLALDPEAARAMGREGRRRVEQLYSLERGAALVAETYRLACGPPDPSPRPTAP
jgi:glycosyltransferase involved in cell wall biosynthesis